MTVASRPRARRCIFVVLGFGLLLGGLRLAAQETKPPSPASFDPVAATNAYLATVAGEDRARSDAYFEGGYWLQLWDFLLGVAVNLALLGSGCGTWLSASSASARSRRFSTGFSTSS
jgi:STE24 endopeptidase